MVTAVVTAIEQTEAEAKRMAAIEARLGPSTSHVEISKKSKYQHTFHSLVPV